MVDSDQFDSDPEGTVLHKVIEKATKELSLEQETQTTPPLKATATSVEENSFITTSDNTPLKTDDISSKKRKREESDSSIFTRIKIENLDKQINALRNQNIVIPDSSGL
jgi:hypothetical protein